MDRLVLREGGVARRFDKEEEDWGRLVVSKAEWVALKVGPHLLGTLRDPLLVLVGQADVGAGKMVKGGNVLPHVSGVTRNTYTHRGIRQEELASRSSSGHHTVADAHRLHDDARHLAFLLALLLLILEGGGPLEGADELWEVKKTRLGEGTVGELGRVYVHALQSGMDDATWREELELGKLGKARSDVGRVRPLLLDPEGEWTENGFEGAANPVELLDAEAREKGPTAHVETLGLVVGKGGDWSCEEREVWWEEGMGPVGEEVWMSGCGCECDRWLRKGESVSTVVATQYGWVRDNGKDSPGAEDDDAMVLVVDAVERVEAGERCVEKRRMKLRREDERTAANVQVISTATRLSHPVATALAADRWSVGENVQKEPHFQSIDAVMAASGPALPLRRE